MVKVRGYKNRKTADKASSYLISKGIPAIVKGYINLPVGLEHFKDSMVELTVPEHLYNKAIEYLAEYENKMEDDSKK